MWKKIRTISLILLLFVSLSYIINIRLFFLESRVKSALNIIQNQQISFDRIDYKFVNRLIIKNLKVSDVLECPQVIVYINPVELLKTPKNPENFIEHIHFEKPVLFTGQKMFNFRQDDKVKGDMSGKFPSIDITWSGGNVRNKYFDLENSEGSFRIDDKIIFILSGLIGQQKLAIKLEMENNKAAVRGNIDVDISGNDTQINMSASCHYTNKNQFKMNVFVPKIKWKTFDIYNSTGSFIFDKEAIKAEVSSLGFKIDVFGANLNDLKYKAAIDFSKLNKLMSGSISLDGNVDEAGLTGRINVLDLVYRRFLLGSTQFECKYDKNRKLTCKGSSIKTKYIVDLSLDDLNELFIVLKDRKNITGKITGKLTPLNLNIDVTNLSLSEFPVLFLEYSEPLKGYISIKGNLTESNSFINLNAAGLKTNSNDEASFKAELIEKNKQWQLKSESLGKDWYFQGNWKNEKDWDVDMTFNEFKVENILPLLDVKFPLKCRVSGLLAFSSKNTGKLNVKLKDIFWGEDNLGDGIIDFDMSKDMVSLQKLSFYNNKGTLTGNGGIDLSSQEDNCRINLSCHNYYLKQNMINGNLTVIGDYYNAHNWKFNGKLESEGIQVNKWPNKPFLANIVLTKDKLEVINYNWHTLSTGKLDLSFRSKALHGDLIFTNIPIGNIVKDAGGKLNGKALVVGSLTSPIVAFNYSANNTKYRSFLFNHSGIISYANRTISLQNIKMLSGKSFAELNGRIWPNPDVKVNLRSLPLSLLNKVIKLPFHVSGTTSGDFKLSGSYDNPNLNLNASCNNLSVYRKNIDEVKFKLDLTDKKLKISKLTIKYSDSEISLLKGSFLDFNNNEYFVKTEYKNLRLGLFEIFGGITYSGKWNFDKHNKIVINSVLATKKLWVNQHNLENISVGVLYKDNNLILKTKNEQSLKINGVLDLSNYPKIYMKHCKISKKIQGEVAIDGEIGKNRLKFDLFAKNIPALVVSELADLPVYVDGSLGVNIKADGTPERPRLQGEINLSNGNIADMPFDNFYLQVITKEDNILSISKLKLVEKDKYSIMGSGFVPFYFTNTSKKRMQNTPLNLVFSIEKGNLSLLSNMSKDIKSAKGEINSQITLSGTLNKIIGNGYLKITKGEIYARRYFQKLTKLKVFLSWKNNLLSVKEFSATIGQGDMALNGKVVFSKLKPKNIDLTWQTTGKRGISISVPELPIPSSLFSSENLDILTNYSAGEPKFNIKFKGPADGIHLSGWVEMENTHFTYPSIVKAAGEDDIFAGLWPNIVWDLELRSGKNTWYENELASVNTSGGIKLTGKGEYPKVEGKVEAIRGNVIYLGKEFKINKAVFETRDAVSYLEGEAEIEVYGKDQNSYDTIKLFIDKSKIEDIKPRFVSKNDLNLASEQAFQKATGLDSSESLSTNSMFRKQLVRFFGSSLTTPVARNLLKRTGIADTFKIQYVDDANTSQLADIVPASKQSFSDILAGTKYSMEKSLNDKMLFGYSVTLDQIQDKLDTRHELELSYRWTKNIFLKGLYQIPTNNPFMQYDKRITIEQQWRFGLPKKKREGK
ncbi:MAG: translocation/assembly module TamB [Elusimicrobia bacterium]|nr:translocation/assembly module TamB [Candidatus Liberimonas magnetica]